MAGGITSTRPNRSRTAYFSLINSLKRSMKESVGADSRKSSVVVPAVMQPFGAVFEKMHGSAMSARYP